MILKYIKFYVALFLFLSFHVWAQDLIDFSDFEVEYISSDLLSSIDYSSHENAEVFREGLNAAVGQKANFAGKYYLYTTGCGTMCQVLVAIDIESGRMVDMVTASFGGCFQQDSSLLITNPDIESIYEGDLPDWARSSYYQITETGFELIQETKSDFPGECIFGQ